MKKPAPRQPAGFPLRKIIAAMVGGAFLIMLIAYLAAILTPTGYQELRSARLRPPAAQRHTPADGMTTGTATTDSAPREGDVDTKLEPLIQEIARILDPGPDTQNLRWQHPLLDWNTPYYPPVHAVGLVGASEFDTANWRRCLDRDVEWNLALPTCALFSPDAETTRAAAADPAAMAAFEEKLARVADQIEATLLDPQVAKQILARQGEGPNQSGLYELIRHGRLPILRAILNKDAEKTQRHIDIQMSLAMISTGNDVISVPIVVDRLEPFFVLAAERDLLDAGRLAEMQTRLEARRMTGATAREQREKYILSQADDLLANPARLGTQQSPWTYFMDGVPQRALVTVLEPVLKRRIELYAVALIDGDAGKIRRARTALESTAGTINYESDLRNSFSIYSAYDCFVLEMVSRNAPWYADVATDMNRFLDRPVLVLAACRFRAERGVWPESPGELVPTYLGDDHVTRGRATWRFTQTDCGADDHHHFAIVRGTYEDQSLWSTYYSIPLDELIERESQRAGGSPAEISLSSRMNLFCLYEEDFRRILCTKEESTP